MIPSWEEIRELELRRRYPEAITALEKRLSDNTDFEEEVVVRLGFDLWLVVVDAHEKNKWEEPYTSYALRFVELLRIFRRRLYGNADFCWAFGLGIKMFWHNFPGLSKEEGESLMKRAESLDGFWARFLVSGGGGVTQEEMREKFRGRGVFEEYYGGTTEQPCRPDRSVEEK